MLTLIRPNMNDDTMARNTTDHTKCRKHTDQVSGTLRCQGGEGGDYHSEMYIWRQKYNRSFPLLRISRPFDNSIVTGSVANFNIHIRHKMWVWVNSGSWWWTGRPGVLRFMASQRVGHDWATELNWWHKIPFKKSDFTNAYMSNLERW